MIARFKAEEYYQYIGNAFPSERVLFLRYDYIQGYGMVQRLNGDKWSVSLTSLGEIRKGLDMTLPTDAQERKQIPVVTGALDYFPLAIAEVAKCSKAGNDQHHPGEELFWDKTKSTDHADCIGRHLIDRGKFDTDGQRHSAKLAWRALAMLQIELENEKKVNT